MKNHNETIKMKKNIPLLLISLLFFMAADAQAQEWCDENPMYEDSGCVDRTHFYAKILGGANFLQNTSIQGNKATYETGYIVAGSLGYCWHYGLRFEGEYAFRKNAIEKIHFFTEGSSNHGYFQTSSAYGQPIMGFAFMLMGMHILEYPTFYWSWHRL